MIGQTISHYRIVEKLNMNRTVQGLALLIIPCSPLLLNSPRCGSISFDSAKKKAGDAERERELPLYISLFTGNLGAGLSKSPYVVELRERSRDRRGWRWLAAGILALLLGGPGRTKACARAAGPKSRALETDASGMNGSAPRCIGYHRGFCLLARSNQRRLERTLGKW